MRTSLNDIHATEQYLLRRLNAGDAAVFETRLLTNPVLRNNMAAQQKLLSIIKQYHRNKLRADVETVHRQLFTDPVHSSFRQRVLRIFE